MGRRRTDLVIHFAVCSAKVDVASGSRLKEEVSRN